MFRRTLPKCSGKYLSLILLSNFLLWVYFAVSFAHAAYAYQPDLIGEPNGTGFTFWGRSLALVESGFKYPFFRITVYVEFLSYAVIIMFTKLFDPNLSSDCLFWGISEGGWNLVGTMLLSFVQWYFACRIFQWFWNKRKDHKKMS
jgi:hypothetical protein